MPTAAPTNFLRKRVANPRMRRLPTQMLLETIGGEFWSASKSFLHLRRGTP